MHFHLILLAIFAFIWTAQGETVTFDPNVEIAEVERIIDVRTQSEDVISQYKFQNTGTKPLTKVLVAFPESQASHLAFVGGFITSKKEKTSVSLVTTPVNVSGVKSPEGTIFYQITLKDAIQPQASGKVQIVSSFTHVLNPLPKFISQTDSQFVKLTENGYVYSPYTSTSQTTQVKLPHGAKVESYTKRKANVKGDEITIGPFENVSPFSNQEFSVHFENNHPFVTFRTLKKIVEVSHWGNVAIEEHYLLEHTGAQLAGSFSRYDYQRTPSRASFRQITAILPASAADIYYRDHIGNVSTSHVRHDPDKTVFEVAPRFPMFGGWKTDFYIGYNLPASEFLSIDSDTGKYVLNVSFGSPFPSAVVDDFEARIILPEGSGNIEWSTPFDIDSEDRSSVVTYLDLTGRPVLILRKQNVVKLHAQPLLVAYDFSRLSIYREPLMLTTAFLLFFLVSIVYTRFELSISPMGVIRTKKRGGGRRVISELETLYADFVAKIESNEKKAATESETQLTSALASVQGSTAKQLSDVVRSLRDLYKGKKKDKYQQQKSEGERLLQALK